MQLQTFLSVG